jgi:hypothetical protein
VDRIGDTGQKVVQFLHRACDQKASLPSRFDRYIEGWAETDVNKILAATAPSYRFIDPLVGSFSVRSLYKYFDLLQDRLSYGRAISRFEVAFFLHGPMAGGRMPADFSFGARRHGSGSPGWPRLKSENEASSPNALHMTSTWGATRSGNDAADAEAICEAVTA